MVKVIGIVFFIAGCLGIYWTGKRAFERRNESGVEEFSSYGRAVATMAWEGALRIVCLLILAFGFLTFCVGLGLGR